MNATATPEELEAGRGYKALFVPAVFEPWTRHLIDGAGVEKGAHVLDIACGSGVFARACIIALRAFRPHCWIDPAPGMIAAAREVEPSIEWVLGSAEGLEFDDDIFDCIVTQFGMMFFEDRHAASSEMFRVLKPGGRLAIAV